MQHIINSFTPAAVKVAYFMIGGAYLLAVLMGLSVGLVLFMTGNDTTPATAGEIRSIIIGALLIGAGCVLLGRLLIRACRAMYLGRL